MRDLATAEYDHARTGKSRAAAGAAAVGSSACRCQCYGAEWNRLQVDDGEDAVDRRRSRTADGVARQRRHHPCCFNAGRGTHVLAVWNLGSRRRVSGST